MYIPGVDICVIRRHMTARLAVNIRAPEVVDEAARRRWAVDSRRKKKRRNGRTSKTGNVKSQRDM